MVMESSWLGRDGESGRLEIALQAREIKLTPRTRTAQIDYLSTAH